MNGKTLWVWLKVLKDDHSGTVKPITTFLPQFEPTWSIVMPDFQSLAVFCPGKFSIKKEVAWQYLGCCFYSPPIKGEPIKYTGNFSWRKNIKIIFIDLIQGEATGHLS